MWRRLRSIPVPPLARLLILFAILTIPMLAGKVIAQFRGEALSNSAPATPDALRLRS